MPKCPKCGEEIDVLITWKRELSRYRMWFIEKDDEYPMWERVDAVEEEGEEEYECPRCGGLLFKNYEDAVAFLKSK
jgi:predicted RNA-binding Zn-ribbon protein involved in translation (DUF1610 family)